MSIFLIIISGIVFVLLGRLLFQRWYNHVTMYAGIWSFTLALFEIRLLPYYELEFETWLFIISGWLAFLTGALTIVAARSTFKTESFTRNEDSSFFLKIRQDVFERYIKLSLWIIIALSIIPAIQQWMILIAKFGSIKNAIILGNIIYSLRVHDTSLQGIPYLGSFALTGTFLSGVYTGIKGRLTFVSILPLIITIIISIAGMGRSQLIIAMILFMSGYFLFRLQFRGKNKVHTHKLRTAITFWVVLAFIVGGVEFVRSNRGTIENIPGASKSLKTLKRGMIITPSVYLYFTIHYGVLNQYLKVGNEQPIWGGNTFAPLWNIMAKTGITERVPDYMVHYRTPVGSNTATYLRELHADFGFLGVLLFPYFLGLLCSRYWFRIVDEGRLLDAGILAHLYVVVALSFSLGATRWGYWFISLIGTIIASKIIEVLLFRRMNNVKQVQVVGI